MVGELVGAFRIITTGKQSQHSTSTYLLQERKKMKENKRMWNKEKEKMAAMNTRSNREDAKLQNNDFKKRKKKIPIC